MRRVRGLERALGWSGIAIGFLAAVHCAWGNWTDSWTGAPWGGFVLVGRLADDLRRGTWPGIAASPFASADARAHALTTGVHLLALITFGVIAGVAAGLVVAPRRTRRHVVVAASAAL